MEALELIVRLLEKVSVLVASVLVLVLLRPAGVWLGETGSQASLRRRVFLVGVLGALAIWGTFLGFEIGGLRFNIRMIGIIVAGVLGGVGVGLAVGTAAGLVYALNVGFELATWVVGASIFVGLAAGLWSRRFGASIPSVVLGAVLIQALYHVTLGAVMAAFDLEMALSLASNFLLHGAKITANVIGVLLFMGVLELVRELERAREAVRTSRAEARDARLEALQYQVRPHFLFNLLNTLAYLIRTDPPKARELTLELAEFLRYTLSRQEAQTSLFEELRQIRRYVELERARFGEGLRFEIINPSEQLLHKIVVPPLILQPLVENAIRHGSRDGKVSVYVEVVDDGDRAHIVVRDDGPGPDDDAVRASDGVGLQNVRERLERFYHGDATLKLERAPQGGAQARFSVPLSPDGRRGLYEQARRRLEEVVV